MDSEWSLDTLSRVSDHSECPASTIVRVQERKHTLNWTHAFCCCTWPCRWEFSQKRFEICLSTVISLHIISSGYPVWPLFDKIQSHTTCYCLIPSVLLKEPLLIILIEKTDAYCIHTITKSAAIHHIGQSCDVVDSVCLPSPGISPHSSHIHPSMRFKSVSAPHVRTSACDSTPAG